MAYANAPRVVKDFFRGLERNNGVPYYRKC